MTHSITYQDPGDEARLSPTQREARATARRLVDEGAVILDSETTGLDGTARLVEIAILGADGSVLFESLVNPGCPIPAAAVAIHGITDKMVAGAPTLPDLWPVLSEALVSRPYVCAWNAAFDQRILHQHLDAYRMGWLGLDWHCCMLLWSSHQGLWRWARLDQASFKAGVLLNGAHRAKADALATVSVLRWMAGLPMVGEER